jgi:hypothetical protein
MTLIVHYMRGMKRNYAIDKPMISSIWPMQEGSSLSHDEMKSFEEVSFVFNRQQLILL